MDASTASTDSATGLDPGKKALVDGGGSVSLPNHQGRVGSHSVQTFNGSQTMMNSHDSGSAAAASAAVPHGGTVTSNSGSPAAVDSGPVSANKGLPGASNSVIQTPLMNSAQSVSQTAAAPATATVTLVRPPTLNGNNNVMVAHTSGQSGVVNNGQASNRSHIIKAEPPTTLIQSAPQPAAAVSASRSPANVAAAGPGGIRALTPQMLAPRLPQTNPGQPSIHNIQLPPGMVLVRSESGQLLMIPQQALAQMQAQAQTQGGMAPRTATPTNVSPAQSPGNISRQVAPSTIIRQSCPAPTTLPATTTLHRPPILQSSVGAPVPGMTPRTASQTAGTTVTSVTVSKETMENVKKCKNFLATLIKLASSGKQTTETAAIVRELVKELLEGKLEAEEFTSRLYKELNSSPQPYLVPFLKRSLPALRQLTPDSAAFIQQSQHPQPTQTPVSSTSPTLTPTTVVLGSPTPRLTAPINRPPLHPGISRPGQTPSLVLQPQQQRAMLRPQATSPSTPMVTLRNQAPGRILTGQQQVQLKELQPVPVRPDMPSVSTQAAAAALTQANRNKLKEAGGTFKDDDDINDVASMAGVNLSEESANILATNSGLVGVVTHSCKDEAFISCALLQRRMLNIARKYGVTDLGVDVVNYVSYATQQRLQNLLEKVSQVAQQKNINFKDDNHDQSSDVRAQLKFFEQLDQLEKQRKEEQEREILLKAAKSRARQEDPEQLRLKQKAKEMQQQELAQMRQREANLTALAAIGPRKKRRILDSPSSSSAAEGSGTGPSLSGGAASSGSRPTRQRITRVNLRDLLFCLENERFTSRSHFLYKGFLK
ncbi:transcription initiation factor TFIID subunit 4-like [Solea solea]|uniref:transcription initiation factor TFIID subunit 4-like n=1 Tax=Solea solea TaxID=90069 RepID=UPI002729693F|nr:transcription initiation factor TFIID subunit 4-like [Solea solea]XP_058487989.1 transcription initiation factor TFIID subunit 4-like [Solea solea]XP_058487990.1 transcription initiation factor TFIID subunit 4-like [Solea solea]